MKKIAAVPELPYTTDALLYEKKRDAWKKVKVMSRVRCHSVPVMDEDNTKFVTMRLVRVLVQGEREPRFIEASRLKESPG